MRWLEHWNVQLNVTEGFYFVDKRAGDRAVRDQGDQGQAAEVREVARALECLAECNFC